MRFQDQVPASERDTVFWYRVAARTPDGNLSFLSPPERAIFPNRELPLAPTIRATHLGSDHVGCEIAVDSTDGPWSFTSELSATPLGVNCGTRTIAVDTVDGNTCKDVTHQPILPPPGAGHGAKGGGASITPAAGATTPGGGGAVDADGGEGGDSMVLPILIFLLALAMGAGLSTDPRR